MYNDFFGNDPYYGAQDYYASIYNYFYWIIGLVIAAVVIGVILNFTFLKRSNEGRFKGFAGKLYDLLSMNRFYTEDIIKLLEVITFLAITFLGLYFLFTGNIAGGILMIIFGNLLARLLYELIIMFAILTRKTVSMDKRLAGIEKFYSDDMDDWEGTEEPDTEEDESAAAEDQEKTFEDRLKETFGDLEDTKAYGYDEECRECDNWDEVSEDCYCEDDCLTCEKPDQDKVPEAEEETEQVAEPEAVAEPEQTVEPEADEEPEQTDQE